MSQPKENQTLILFLGRSTLGIFMDVQEAFPDAWNHVIIITRDDEKMEPPEGVADEVISISDWEVIPGVNYFLVANGGTTAQLFGVLRSLFESNASYVAYDVQRSGEVIKVS